MSDSEDKIDFERRIGKAYQDFVPLAEKYYYTFRRISVTEGGVPTVLFLGNHSSGKSTLINWVLGGDAIQDTGVAPTDDGFTLITYGETEEDICGPAVLTKLNSEFSNLQSFGPGFLQHLRLKIRKRELLKKVCLIDSPGMIDSGSSSASRDYDFQKVVRFFAELCDTVFFLFDPEKPGTTGETVEVFSNCLRGMEFKLRVLLNKCDNFAGAYDFARAYGTLCWNLARVLHTKDLPKIFTTYSGDRNMIAGSTLTTADFDRHREEFLAILADASQRRFDNVYAQAHADFTGLAVRMRVVNSVIYKLRLKQILSILAYSGITLLASFIIFYVCAKALGTTILASENRSIWKLIIANIAGLITGGITAFASYVYFKYKIRSLRQQFAETLDDIFKTVYCNELALGGADDIRQIWNNIKDETAEIIRNVPLHLPLFIESERHKLEKFNHKLRN